MLEQVEPNYQEGKNKGSQLQEPLQKIPTCLYLMRLHLLLIAKMKSKFKKL